MIVLALRFTNVNDFVFSNHVVLFINQKYYVHLLYSIGYYPKGQCFKWYLLKHILAMTTVQITYYRTGSCHLLAGLRTEMAEFKFMFLCL